MASVKQRLFPPKSLSLAELRRAREERLKEVGMWALLRELLGYSCFLAVLLLIVYQQRNANTFLYKNTMTRTFIDNGIKDNKFTEIESTDDFWEWARKGLLKGIRAGPYYNDYPPLLLRGYVNDKVSKILGYATMRQLRIRPNLCELDSRMTAVISQCNVPYDMLDQEEGAFDVGWTPLNPNSTLSNHSQFYRYTDASQLDGFPYWGKLAMYSGGGYVVPLNGSVDDLTNLTTALENEGWIDRYTRAVFVEFTTYNAQVNLFGIATILAEFDLNGGVVTSFRFEPALLLPFMTSTMLLQLACEVAFCVFVLFFIVRMFKQLVKQRLAYFKCFWSWTDLGVIGVALGAVACYFYRLLAANSLIGRLKDYGYDGYIKFQYVGYWNEIYSYMMGWLVFFATIKFLRLLRFNRRISMLGNTLQNGARSMLNFSIIFWIVFLGFAMLFFMTFKNVDISYSSFIRSVVSLITMMLGKIDLNNLRAGEPVLVQFYVFTFMTSVTFIIVNMFVSILNETFSSVREDLSKQSNDYEIVDFIVARFKRFLGLGPPPNTLNPEDLKKMEQDYKCPFDKYLLSDRLDRVLLGLAKEKY